MVTRTTERGTAEIRAFARRFAAEAFDGARDDDDRSSGTHGVEPIVEKRINARDESDGAVQWLLDRRAAGDAWRDLVVLAPGKRNWRDPLAKALDRAGIPYRMLLGDPQAGPDLNADLVHVMTLHAIEGLAFPVVAVVGIGDFPWKSQTLDEVARLLHVAMTRATHALRISYSKPSTLVERLLAMEAPTSP